MEYISDNLLLGAHMSIAGGLDQAIVRADRLNCTALQIFTKNQLRWSSPQINNEQVYLFKEKFLKYRNLKRVVAHATYLINLATNDKKIVEKSREAVFLEIERSIKLGIAFYVLHPGFHRGSGIKAGIKNLASNLKDIISTYKDDIILCIETMSGQGSSLGSSFDEISEIISRVGGKGVGVCFDTCHVFSAGYDIRNWKSYTRTMNEFDRLVGMDKLKVIHLNDSKGSLGSRIDRHMHIGKGEIGLRAFKYIMNDSRFQGIPKIIETPKENNPEKYDRMNLDQLRSLIYG